MRILRSDVALAVLATFIFFVLAVLLMEQTVAVSILAGALTGLFEGTLMFPLENIKIQQQLDGTGMRKAIRRTWTHHGAAGFYRGLTPVLMGAIPTQAIRWGCFEAFCSISDCRDLTNVGIAAIISGIINSFVTGVPVETWKVSLIHANVAALKKAASPVAGRPTQRQASNVSRGVASCSQAEAAVSSMISVDTVGGEAPEETRIVTDSYTDLIAVMSPLSAPPSHHAINLNLSGAPATGGSVSTSQAKEIETNSSLHVVQGGKKPMLLYKGWVPTVGKKVINQAIRFPAHSWALRILCRFFVATDASLTTCRHGHPLLNFIAGGFAGLSSILITQPLDVAKTRMQGLHGERYENTVHCLRSLVQDEGLAAFMQGVGVRALRTSLGAGISFALFPWVQTLLSLLWGGPGSGSEADI